MARGPAQENKNSVRGQGPRADPSEYRGRAEMTRRTRIALFSASGLVLVLIAAGVTGLFVARSAWLREKVRQRIVLEASNATGGRVEIGAFRFDWRTLTAELDNLVVHGTEPSGEAPLLAIDRVLVGLRIVSLMERDFDVARVEVE